VKADGGDPVEVVAKPLGHHKTEEADEGEKNPEVLGEPDAHKGVAGDIADVVARGVDGVGGEPGVLEETDGVGDVAGLGTPRRPDRF